MNRARVWVLLALLPAALLSACSRDMSDLQQYVAEVKGRKTRAIEPIPQMEPYVAFAYTDSERRDPFVKVEPEGGPADSPLSAIRPDLKRNREPLEEYPLDSLRMVGVIEAGQRSFALIKAPDSVIHRVTVGDHIGQNFGEILKISETELSLLEIIPDGFGGWMQRPAVLAVSEP